MRRAVLVTCERWPEISASDALYAEALAARGLSVQALPWNGAQEPFRDADVVILRSNWDYHYTPEAFVFWLEDLAGRGTAVFNPPGLVAWNLDKTYVLDLAARGVPAPQTHLVDGDGAAVAQLLRVLGWDRAVVKPAVGASGHRVGLVSETTGVTTGDTPPGRWIVQEYMPEVTLSGELSCVFFAGAYAHSFVRRPRSGEFRVNSQYEGTAARAQPNDAVVGQARAILDLLPELPLYARADGVVRGGVFTLMELELNEPSLRLDLCPPSAGLFADATLRRLRLGQT